MSFGTCYTFIHNSDSVFVTFVPFLALWADAWPASQHPQLISGSFQCDYGLTLGIVNNYWAIFSTVSQCYFWQFCPEHAGKSQTTSNVALCTCLHTTTVIPCHLPSCRLR